MIAAIESLKEADKLVREINTRFAAISTQAQRREPTHNELLDVLRFALGNLQGLVRHATALAGHWRLCRRRCSGNEWAATIRETLR